ncbi:acyl transferase [Maribacter sp. PR1]|uniref:Acyl transferase n=1 Tax=Maribacter cobaltidurans TaxID=1178778 RepID=A0ABU7ISU6_9FLAO|nr:MULTISPECIES: acyl transferase [Maribacter]MDC6388213.1 acyl transferase [Maribacter sp. PR1]MEE1975601.1 acyl transferase [Maribacter cobaltidurans]
MNQKGIFNIDSDKDFISKCLDTFLFQYNNNIIYGRFCDYLKVNPAEVSTLEDIPFLPIQFFKKHKIVSATKTSQITFLSSGTTGATTSKHYVTDLKIYKESYLKGFERFYGTVEDYCILALLPSYMERNGSSLIYMVNDLIKKSNHPKSGFFLNDFEKLKSVLMELEAENQQVLLIGVSFALLEFAERYQLGLKNTLVMETGGMKGRRKELIRKELHELLKQGFGVEKVHSEYGMTELLSQAYSKGNSLFECPPWMKVLIRDTEDPLTVQPFGKVGGINVIDLANINSCSFIATQDLGKMHASGKFEILGRFDHSDIRGCNLMAL